MLTEYVQLMPKEIRTSRWLFIYRIADEPLHHIARLLLGSKGHEIVAAIAEIHLTDSARKRMQELFPRGTTLAEASTWPDKARRQIPDMDPYHFINFPKDANDYQQRDCKLRNCVIEATPGICRCSSPLMRRGMKSESPSASLPISSAISTSRFMPDSRKIVEGIALI